MTDETNNHAPIRDTGSGTNLVRMFIPSGFEMSPHMGESDVSRGASFPIVL